MVEELVECFYGEGVVENVNKGVGNKFKWGEILEDMFEFELRVEGVEGILLFNVV